MAHVGCVTAPKVGAAGVTGCTLTVVLAEAADVHPEVTSVTVAVYVPAGAVTTPVADTDPISGALLVQVPPVGFDTNVVVAPPAQTVLVPEIAEGTAFTVAVIDVREGCATGNVMFQL